FAFYHKIPSSLHSLDPVPVIDRDQKMWVKIEKMFAMSNANERSTSMDNKSSVQTSTISTPNSIFRTASPCPSSVDEEAFIECVNIIESGLGGDNVINIANNKERKWWIDGNYKKIDEKRLPLRLIKDVTYHDYEKKSKIANASRFWEFDDGCAWRVFFPISTRFLRPTFEDRIVVANAKNSTKIELVDAFLIGHYYV
ncbi:131_t:CDS:2, partial [Dentiscutata heterogama]